MSAADPLVLKSRLQEADFETMADALSRAEPLALWAATYQLTGDRRLLELGRDEAAGASWEHMIPPGFAGPEDLELLRIIALDALERCRNGDLAPEQPTEEQFLSVLGRMFLEPIPEQDAAWWWEEFAATPLPRVVEEVRFPAGGSFRVLIIGAGMNGIAAAVGLEAAGIEYTVVERNAGVGGTWHSNTYPGARVDVASRSYSYSFEADYHWEHHYALQQEILQYFDYVVDKYDIRPHIRFDTGVESACWNETEGVWEVDVRSNDGSSETVKANAVISAVGLFNRPNYPTIAGLEDFTGHVIHTTKWDHAYDLTGKKVALIGTGASGTQLVAGIAPVVSSLAIFQRAGSWVSNVPDYVERINDEEHWMIDHFPYYINWVRVLNTYALSDKRIPLYDVDESWPDPDSVSEMNAKIRAGLVSYVTSKLGDRPDLLEKCIPKYPAMAKRLPKDNGWFDALKRDNVDLVVDPIDRVTATGVRTESGREIEADVLILATGFRANDYLWPMRIEGRDGTTLEKAWEEDGARAYLGITIPGFPNLFCTYGPNTNSKSGGICMWGEMQSRYIIKCMKYLIENGRTSLSVKPEVFSEFNEVLDHRLSNSVWMDQRQTSYYRNQFNRIATQAPWATLEYWRMTIEPELEDFIVS